MATEDIAGQTETTYEQYKKIKSIVDLGYFLENYIVTGGVVTKDVTYNNIVNATEIVVSLDNDVTRREAASFKTKSANTTYYLDYMSSGDFNWDTAHYSGSYLPVAQVTTDANKNVASITDMRGTIGGVRFKYDAIFNGYSLGDIGSRVNLLPKSNVMLALALDDIASIPANALLAARDAIANKNELRVVFYGDSITEGADQVNQEDAYAKRLEQSIRNALPGVVVQVANYGLGGRNLAMATDPNYKGLSSEPENITLGYYRNWSTVGKSWIDTVRDFKPDLIILGFGANDGSMIGTDSIFANYLDLFKTTINGWDKTPSVAVIPVFVPSKDHGGDDNTYPIFQAIARATREFGKNNGWTVADVNRLYRILRFGDEDVTRIGRQEKDFAGYNTLWTLDTASFNLNNGTLSPKSGVTNKSIARDFNFYNGTSDFTFNPAATGYDGMLSFTYRNRTDYGNMSVYVFAGASGFAQLNADGAVLATSPTANIPVGSNNTFKLVTKGSHHQLYINGVLLIDAISYRKQHEGAIIIGSSGTPPVISNFSISALDPVTTTPLYTETELLGEYNSPLSGNGINHPTGLGHALFYLPAFNGLVRGLGTYQRNEVYRTTKNMDVYVNGTTGSDANDGLSSTTPVKTWQAAMNRIPNGTDHDVMVHATAFTYAESILISGYTGKGELSIIGGDNASYTNFIVSSIIIKNVQVPLYIQGITANTVTDTAFNAEASTKVTFNYCNVTASAASKYGFYIDSSDAYIQNSIASNRFVGISAQNMATVFTASNAGSGNVYGLESSNASSIGKSGTQPAGATAEVKSGGGVIN